jgi:hypothetical protein
MCYAYPISPEGPNGGKAMKLVATDTKVTIKWFWVAQDGTKYRNNKGFIHNAWEATCSCGWETKSGGAIKASIQRDVEDHKFFVHNYTWNFGK